MSFQTTYIAVNSPSYEGLHSNLKSIYDTAIQHYGIERVSLNNEVDPQKRPDDTDNVLTYILWIYYPELTISNSAKRTHTIRDLYVRIPLSANGKILKKFRLHRTTLTKIEMSKAYIHSHSTTDSYYNVSNSGLFGCMNVCLGSGEIVDTLARLRETFDLNVFGLFLFQLDTFVAWESLEGGPYSSGMARLQDEYNISNSTINYLNLNHIQHSVIQDLKCDSSVMFSVITDIAAEISSNPQLILRLYEDDLASCSKVNIANSYMQLFTMIANTNAFRKIAKMAVDAINGHQVSDSSIVLYIDNVRRLSADLSTAYKLTRRTNRGTTVYNTEAPILYFHGEPRRMRLFDETVAESTTPIYGPKPKLVYKVKYLLTMYINQMLQNGTN